MRKLKVCTVLGTRPEIIRLSRVIHKLDKYFDHSLIHTGQNYDYELNEVFFEDLELKAPNHYLESADKSSSALNTIGNILIKLDPLLDKIKPDAMLILGDTNSSIASVAAKRKKIPIFHMEAGNRSFDERVPEEINRRLVDHISDINLPYSSIAREYLISEGIPSNRVIKTGSPMYEVLDYFMPKIKKSTILSKLNLKKNRFFVLSSHREENIDFKFKELVDLISFLEGEYEIPIFVTCHPRTKAKFESENIKFSDKVILSKPLGFIDYVFLQMNAFIVLSDSGTISEESSILNFPALNIRDSHERPEAMEEGSVMMVGYDKKMITNAIEILEKQGRGSKSTLNVVKDYQAKNVSEKVARIILSYTDYVNKNIWKK